MSQLPEIPASAYTPEMNTLGAIPDITVFEGERVPVSRNALTPGTRPLQLLPLPSTEFPVRHETSAMRGFQTEVSFCVPSTVASRNCSVEEQFCDATVRQGGNALNSCVARLLRCVTLLFVRMQCLEQLNGAAVEVDLGKARAGGSSRVVTAGFGDYTARLHRTQPRFPPIMRYALMERWNDCNHTFIFGFGEMTLTPADYTAITGLGFNGRAAPLGARYQTATLGAELVRTLLGVTTQTRYTAQGCVSYEVVYRFWAEQIRTRLAAWRELPVEARPTAPAYTREERDQAARSFIFYIISSQLLCTSQNKGDPAVLVCLWDLSQVWAYEYRIYPGGSGVMLRLIPDGFLGIWRTTIIPSPLLLTPWEGDDWQAYPACAVAEAYSQSRFLLRGYWLDRYFLGERIYELQLATVQRRAPHAPPCHMCLLEGMTPEDREDEYIGSPADIPLSAGDYATYFSTRLQARLLEFREYIQERKKHRTL
ncbi:hypothetical protein JCGZ_19448 [Jatropha curcas]|uniref:Aminotransferase-like plant mobile domain-containing protein n=1 Tax=Jatropha curcas TaxID=180498 RepID=A0A067KAK4_JATCU|nr:hypothetical protein JCGZ_19448 [Jatropha curcas]